MNIQQAITTPRVHHQLLPHRVHSEHGYDGKALTGLEERGHEVDRMPEGKGLAVVQAVMRLPLERGGVVQAGADPRKGGLAVAY